MLTDRVGKRDDSPVEPEEFAAIGDTISIRDPSSPEWLTLHKRVDVDGTILLPELGAVEVAGYTAKELAVLLNERWAQSFPGVSVLVEIAAGASRGVACDGAEARSRPLLRGILARFRAWLNEWVLHPPILIASAPSRGWHLVAKRGGGGVP